MSKKGILDNVYYNLGKQQYDFYVAGTFKQKDGETGFTKWKKYSEAVMPIDFDGTCDDWQKQGYFRMINQRQILPNELVLDVEEPEQMKEIMIKLESLEHYKAFMEYKIYSTGSRGYHIHLFFKKEVKEEHKLHFVEYLGTDLQKCSEKCLIALEGVPHWKTGKPKTLIGGGEL